MLICCSRDENEDAFAAVANIESHPAVLNKHFSLNDYGIGEFLSEFQNRCSSILPRMKKMNDNLSHDFFKLLEQYEPSHDINFYENFESTYDAVSKWNIQQK